MQGGLHGEDAAQLIADPSGDAHGLAELFHGNGVLGIQCLLMGDAFPVACKYRFLHAGTEECGEEERGGWRCSALALPIEAFKVCVQEGQVMAASTEPMIEPGEKGGKESACVHEVENRSRSAQQEEFQDLFVESSR